MRHKHADLIHAWAEGAEIEHLVAGTWVTVKHPSFLSEEDYRIKPQKKPDVVKYYRLSGRFNLNPVVCDGCGDDDLKITFDGDTGKLIKAEVIGRN